jgi:DNA mismatch repair protein MutS
MDGSREQLLVITGPNMAGKSTFIRQAALLVLMAQIGSFIPAKKAEIGVIDKLFTRIGASDDLSRGQSTFMVEMSETASILHNATSKSLVILDEIGRGTSTYDGIAIAWSVADYLLTIPGKKAKTLFATHYFELTELQEQITGAVNYNVAVEESDRGLVFLHRIVRGGADKSYGIHVPQLAGLPPPVLKKAHEMLKKLHTNAPEFKSMKESQLELF